VFLTALPAASIVGGPLSGWILDHVQGLGLRSWRWLLILEAVPAVACGFLTLRYLPDRPADASFLTAVEKRRIHEGLAAEAALKPGAGSVFKSLTHPRILHLAGIHFLFLMGLYLSGFWMPQSIKALAAGYSNTAVGALVMIPNAASLLAMVWVSRSSDRHEERYWHAAVPLSIAAAALYFVGTPGSLGLRVALWSAVASGLASYLGPFWACPGQFLSGRAAASALAFINSVGSLGSFFSLSIIGRIANRTGSLEGGFRAVAVALVLAAALLLAQKFYRPGKAVAGPDAEYH
jgi:ACS family tartrate transporter-like MFS transporter